VSLYPDARSSLSKADQGRLDLWERSAEAMPPDGPNVVNNLRNESHLVGNLQEEEPSALRTFLLGIVTRFANSDAQQAFTGAAGNFMLQGRLLAVSPDGVYRFLTLDRFGEIVARANGPGDISIWKRDRDAYVTDLIENWETIGREKVSRAMLGARACVFVTFERPDGKVVTDVFEFGPEIMQALGVVPQAAQDVISLRYPRPTDEPLKYPTTADGGWYQYFAAPRPTDAHGWTRAISSPETQGWPEAVHQNRKADLVTERPLRYSGV